MLVDWILGVVFDALLGSPAALGRQFEHEMNGYLDRRFRRRQESPKAASA